MINEKIVKFISGLRSKSEKMKWKRLHERMHKLLDEIHPIEEKILELHNSKIPINDKITALRVEMVETCIHPKEMLVVKDGHVLCKFCNKHISIPPKYNNE